MPKHVALMDENKVRLWWASITNEENKEIALSFLKGLIEECILAGRGCMIEIWTEKKFHQDIQRPIEHQVPFEELTS